MSEDTMHDLIEGSQFGTLATIKRDGRPQMSPVTHHYDPDRRLLRVSITDGRAKTKNLRRDPRASYIVTSSDGWSYAVAEGTVELTAVAGDVHDDAVGELVDLFRAVQGEHPDWDEYRTVMVRDRRLVLKLHVDRVYGTA